MRRIIDGSLKFSNEYIGRVAYVCGSETNADGGWGVMEKTCEVSEATMQSRDFWELSRCFICWESKKTSRRISQRMRL